MLGKLFLCILGVQAAFGAVLPGGEEPTLASISAADYPDQSEEAIKAYWTPERMAHAKPIEFKPTKEQEAQFLRDLHHQLNTEHQEMVSVPGVLPKEELSAQEKFLDALDITRAIRWNTRGDVLSRTVGKLFLTLANGQSVSATAVVVNSASKVLLFTAGHVVHTGRGGAFNRNFLFVPDYYYNNRPVGTFSFKNAFVPTDWINTGDLRYNYGAIITNPLNGRRIVDVVGAQGIVFNANRNVFAYQFGYSSGIAGYDGEALYYCTGNTYQKTTEILGQTCNLRNGASGGPWLINFAGAIGQVNGVYSHALTNEPNSGFSPYFGPGVQNFYNQVAPRT